MLPPAVAAIKQAYPQVSVHLQQAGEADALDRLNQGDADIAIISTAGGEPTDGIAVPLFRWRRLWWCRWATRWTAPAAPRT